MAEQQGGPPGGGITLDRGGSTIINIGVSKHFKWEWDRSEKTGRGSAVGACVVVGSGFGRFEEMMAVSTGHLDVRSADREVLWWYGVIQD